MESIRKKQNAVYRILVKKQTNAMHKFHGKKQMRISESIFVSNKSYDHEEKTFPHLN